MKLYCEIHIDRSVVESGTTRFLWLTRNDLYFFLAEISANVSALLLRYYSHYSKNHISQIDQKYNIRRVKFTYETPLRLC
jgi:hypothetical protein